MHLSNLRYLLALALSIAAAPLQPAAQPVPSIIGNYTGDIGPKQANLRFKANLDGTLRGSLDHLDPAAPWQLALGDIEFDGHTVRFTVPTVNATFEGEPTQDGSMIAGVWTQKGASFQVTFTLQKFAPALHPSALDGIWLELQPGPNSEPGRNQLVFRSDLAGREYCTLDQLDVWYMDEECADVNFNGHQVSFLIPAAGLSWSGQLSADGSQLTGNWAQKLEEGQTTKTAETSSDFHRQQALSAPKPRHRAVFVPALPPVDAASLESVLDNDLAEALQSGDLAPATGSGVTIAVYTHGVRRVFSYGAAKPDSIFEIGSITKTFTGLLLAQMAEQGSVRLDEPVRELLPAGRVAKPVSDEITLLDLATQRSGLPPMPDNIDLGNMDNPYADYHVNDLLAYIGKHGVANPNHVSSPFGSLGFGLLGVALANRAGISYSDLIKKQITDPLGMQDTAVSLSPGQLSRLVAGHDQFHKPAAAWDSDALAGAIALRSTAGDMLTFLAANLHPERVETAEVKAGARTLAPAIRQSLELTADASPGMQIGLGWLYEKESGSYWHNGATAAYSSYAFFNPGGDYAAVVLLNASPGVNGSFVEVLGRHIRQRLTGKPAISLTHY